MRYKVGQCACCKSRVTNEIQKTFFFGVIASIVYYGGEQALTEAQKAVYHFAVCSDECYQQIRK